MRTSLAAMCVLAQGTVLALQACADASHDGSAGIAYDTVAGVEHVISAGPGLWAEGGGWRLDEDAGIAIGEVDGEGDYVFGRISDVLVDPRGLVHVADAQSAELRVFSSDGRFVRRLGREGEGPGEFGHISGLAVAPSGVAALDGRLNRVTVFGLAGDVARTFRLQRPYMILEHHAAMAFDSSGRFFDRARLARGIGVDSLGVITYAADGSVADTALLAVIPADQVTLERDGVPYMSIPRPFAPRVSIAFGPDGTVYLSRGNEYRIDVFSPSGDSLRAIRRTVEPPRVTEAERDSALVFIRETLESSGGRLPAGVELPERKGVITRLVVDAEENLWVLHEAGAGATRFEWSVHDAEGRFLGTVSTPVMGVTQIGRDLVAGVTTDELGVQRAVVIPIRKGAG